MIRIGLHGSTGRMGKTILETTRGAEDHEVIVAVNSRSDTSEFNRLFDADVIIDFSSPQGLELLTHRISDRISSAPPVRIPVLLSGTTGAGANSREALETLAMRTPVLWAPNFSLGIHLVQLALKTWRHHPALRDFQTFILDVHHSEKKDAPSGTALLLNEALGQGSPIESIREGTVIGQHEVRLTSARESVSLSHDVQDRRVFAEGALFSARELILRREILPKKLLTLDDLFVPVAT